LSGHSSLVHYLRVLRRGMLVVFATLLVFTAGAVFLSLRQERLYRASAEVFLNSQDLVAALSNVAVSYFDPVRDSQTQANLAATPAVAQRAIEAAGVKNHTPDELLGNTSITPTSNADVLTFSVTDPNPATASLLATAYAKAYTSYRQQLDTRSLERARIEIQQRLDQIEAEGGRNSPLYSNLSEKEQQLRTTEVLQGSKTLLVRSAGRAGQIQPQPVRNGILSGILGLFFGIGLAFLLDALNTRVRTATEVQERLDLPLLARVGETSKRLRRANRIVMLSDPQGPGAESYRILATNLEFVNLDRGAKSIMITSALRAEGKSTTAANLSVALARAGHRVTLVDLDLRLPTIHKFFDLDQGVGLAHVVLGRASLDEALVKIPILDEDATGFSSNGSDLAHVPPEDRRRVLKDEFQTTTGPANGRTERRSHSRSWLNASRARLENGKDAAAWLLGRDDEEEEPTRGGSLLQVLPTGPLPPNPAQFVDSHALGKILSDLQEQSDIVIVDSPPLLALSDTVKLTRKVDAVVVVARLSLIRRATLEELRRVLEGAPTAKLGTVVTGATAQDGYGYGYGYAYSYGRRSGRQEKEPVR
jgi:Mrp family chromosome partitioning ATPase/capsular polysaccharide biosynthesis protein